MEPPYRKIANPGKSWKSRRVETLAKKLRNGPLRESHFLNCYFLNSRGGVRAWIASQDWAHSRFGRIQDLGAHIQDLGAQIQDLGPFDLDHLDFFNLIKL